MDDALLSLSTGDMTPREAYRLLVSVVVPRPIAWVSSLGAGGALNLAPFSFFTVVGDDPPTVMISIGQRRGGSSKDTLRNALETGELVVNIVSRELAERMNLTSGEWEYGVSESEKAGLRMEPSTDVRPPRVAEAPVSLEVRVSQVVPVEGTGYTMVLGRVARFHVRRDLLDETGLVDGGRLGAVARLGGNDYTWVEGVFAMMRPKAGEAG